MQERTKMQLKPTPVIKAEIVTSEATTSHPKLHRTLASFSALLINTYIIMLYKIAPSSVELSLVFWLLFFISMVISAKERDASYCFSPMVIATTPFILWGTGLGLPSVVSVLGAAVTIGFQRGITMSSIATGASGLAESLGQSNIKRKIIKLSESDIEAELLLEDDLQEFTEVEAELQKVRKNFDKSKPAMQNALKSTIAKVEQLQKDHARVLVRSAGLSAFLNSINKQKLNSDLEKFKADAEKATDDVIKAQLSSTIDMKVKRIEELNRLDTCLNRVKMQKIQIHEMFSGLMDTMNTLKFTDIITLQASSDAMVQEVDVIRSGLEDLEKGLIEAEKFRKF